MSAALSPDLVARLSKVLGMLGSDHDGEIAAAGRRAHRLLRDAGLTWPEVLQPMLPPPKPEVDDDPLDHGAACASLLNWPGLTDWERGFVTSLRKFKRLSDKQLAVLRELIIKRDLAE